MAQWPPGTPTEAGMANYLVIDADWLEREIRNAENLRAHAQDSGKPVAIAAAGVRLGGLQEIKDLAVPALPAGEGEIRLSIDREPGNPAPPPEAA